MFYIIENYKNIICYRLFYIKKDFSKYESVI